MSQHDFDLANQSRTAFRSDLNNALLALASLSSGATEPSTTFAYQWWADTTTGILKIRNAANSAWVSICALAGGQFKFPAVQNASSDPNTLDDYEESDWTPVLSFVTAGDLSVAYATQKGRRTKIGRKVTLGWNISSSSFTYTTASGRLIITGMPDAMGGADAENFGVGATYWSGITKSGYTQINPMAIEGTSQMLLMASGSGLTQSFVTATDVPSGGNVSLCGTYTYFV